MCRSWDRELISGRSSFSFPISFWTKNVSGCTRERDERIGNFIRTVPRSLNRNLLTNAAKYCWTIMVRCVCAVDELPSAIASTAQSSYAVNSGIFKMLTTRRCLAVMSWTHTQIKLKLVTVLEIILLPWNPPSPGEAGLSTSKLPKYLYILNTPPPWPQNSSFLLEHSFFLKIGHFTENYCIRVYRLNHRWLSEKSPRTFD